MWPFTSEMMREELKRRDPKLKRYHVPLREKLAFWVPALLAGALTTALVRALLL